WVLCHPAMKEKHLFIIIAIMLFLSVHNFMMICKTVPIPMIKAILISSLLFCSIKLSGQKTRTFFVYGGPSLTNVQEIINGEKHFFASPERPFYSIQYHFGISIEQCILSRKNLGLQFGI